jgi:hypothetical protein
MVNAHELHRQETLRCSSTASWIHASSTPLTNFSHSYYARILFDAYVRVPEMLDEAIRIA